jgi:prevent-host-death family protein
MTVVKLQYQEYTTNGGINMAIEISIGQVKRDISELINRVAYQGERIVLTSRGRPKAVLVSLKDYETLRQIEGGQAVRSAWLQESQALAERIRRNHENQVIDVDALLIADRTDLEERDV